MDGITLITCITAVISASNYFFYKLYSIKIVQIEKRIEKLEDNFNKLDNKIDELAERLAKLEVLINRRDRCG